MSARPTLSPPLLLATLVCVLLPAGLGAQACIGLPLEWSPNALALEYGHASGVALYGARVGRAVGSSVSLTAGYSHGRFDRQTHYGMPMKESSGDGVEASMIYRLVQLDLPLCTLASLRYGRSAVGFTQPGWDDTPPIGFRNEVSGLLALMGIGVGREFPFASGTAVIPFALGQIGWSQLTHRQTCDQGCSTPGITEGIFHLEGEAGALLQLGRVHLAATLRMMPLTTDPLLYFPASDGDWINLLSLGIGFVF
jgi:hypothetical protein